MPRAARRLPPVVWTALALGALLLFNALAAPGFFDLAFRGGRLAGSLVDILDRASPVMLLALGMTLVIATGGVDLSVGSVMAVSGAVAAVLLARHGVPAPLAFLAALGTALGAGVWNGLLVAALRLQPIVATLVLMLAGRGLAQLLTRGQILTVRDPVLERLGNGAVLGLPTGLWVAAAVLAAAALAARRTPWGFFTESAGDSPDAARRAGVPVGAARLAAYALGALCAGLAGLLAAADIRAADANTAGLYLELDAIIAVVLGGTALSGGRFSLAGSVLGAILLQALGTTLLTWGVEPTKAPLLKGLAVLAVCLLHGRAAGRPPTPATGRWTAALPALRRLPLAATVGVFLALVALGGARFPGFLSPGVAADLLGDNAHVGLVAVGMTFVILAGGIDLSVGALVALTGITTATLAANGWHPAPAAAAGVALSTLIGAGSGAVIHLFRLPPFLVTLSAMFIARGLAYTVSVQSVALTHPLVAALNDHRLAVPPVGAAFLAAAAAAMVALRSTPLGRMVYAVGGSEEAARLMGLPLGRVKVGVYTLSGLCAGLAGVSLAVYKSSGDAAACVGLELEAIAAVVIGGTLLSGGVGSVVGTVFGVLTLGLIQTLITFEGTLSSWWTRIAVGGLVLAFVLMQRGVERLGGRLVRKERESGTFPC